MNINVIEYFENTVARFPDKVGVEDKDRSLTFSQLKDEALKISSSILAYKDTSRAPICIFLSRSVNAFSSILGILYSGNIYVPLDVKNPAERLGAIVNNIKPFAIITDKKNAPKLDSIVNGTKIFFIEDLLESGQTTETSHWRELIDVDPAYIINTSGSTGVPKGVVVSHRSIIDYIEWLKNEPNFKTTCNDVIGNQTPFFFDKSIFDIYQCIAIGLRLVIIPDSAFVFPMKLLQTLEEKKINFIFWVPSILNTICNYDLLAKFRPQYLDKITVSGEVMPTKPMNYWLKFYPNAVFANCYGPTEITDLCTYYVVNRKFRDDEPLPIGKPCRNIGIVLLDDSGKSISEPNIDGEICVRGTCLSLAYYNDFERSAQVFTQNPDNAHYFDRIYHTHDIAYYNEFGELVYKGRKDFQIKHHGFRIELGEIETALGAIKGLANICVVYDHKKEQIVLFYQAERDFELSEICPQLVKSIAKYMLPERAVRLQKFPYNANGKIDRKALAAML